MTNEEKQLLIKDLCARLPYGVRVYDILNDRIYIIEWFNPLNAITSGAGFTTPIEECKPYLRPMSSMTEEEEREYNGVLKPLSDFMFEQEEEFKPIQLYGNIPFELYEFFNSHHFDYRGLIPMGLAFEAPEGMYKF